MPISLNSPRARSWLPLAILALVLVSGAQAKDKDEPEAGSADFALKTAGSATLGSELAWSNDGSSAATDWRAEKNGLEFSLDADGSLDLTFRTIPWLRTGALFSLAGSGAFNTQTDSGVDPVMVLAEADLTGLLSWYVATELQQADLTWDALVSIDGGGRVLDLTDSDSDYQPDDTDGESFWFRVLPAGGSHQKLTVSRGKSWSVEVKHRVLFWWDAETSYGRNWNLGFDEGAEITGRIAVFRSPWGNGFAEVTTQEKLSSGITVPTVKGILGARVAFEDKKFRLRLTPVRLESRADVPDWDWAQADRETQLAGGVDCRLPLAAGNWQVSFQWPWQAWGNEGQPDESLKQWKLSWTIELED